VITQATVLEATPWQAEAPQTIVFGDPKEPRYLGTCDVSTPDGPGFKPRAAISVEGLVVASGVFVSGGGEQRNRVVMVCEHARLARRARGA
jgi:hypothetical protein